MVCGPIGKEKSNGQAGPWRNRTLHPTDGGEDVGDHKSMAGCVLTVSICAPTLASRASSHGSATNRRPVGGDC